MMNQELPQDLEHTFDEWHRLEREYRNRVYFVWVSTFVCIVVLGLTLREPLASDIGFIIFGPFVAAFFLGAIVLAVLVPLPFSGRSLLYSRAQSEVRNAMTGYKNGQSGESELREAFQQAFEKHLRYL